jgi:enoyl-CoA hydratase
MGFLQLAHILLLLVAGRAFDRKDLLTGIGWIGNCPAAGLDLTRLQMEGSANIVNFQNILLSKEEGIGWVTMNRPQHLNALDMTTMEELDGVIDLVAADDEIKVVILTGAGDKAFVAGGDIGFMLGMTPIEARKFARFGQMVLRSMESLPKPIIAAVNGFCLGGGCELMMACDFSVASDIAKFGQPEVGLGVTAGFGGTQRLPRLIGMNKARELLYTGDIIGAEEAARIGLVNKVVPVSELIGVARDIAMRIIAKGQMAVRLSKSALNEGMQTDIDRAMIIESDIFGLCFSTKDQKEGMMAFLEKRSPDFGEK